MGTRDVRPIDQAKRNRAQKLAAIARPGTRPADVLEWEARWSEICRRAFRGEIDEQSSALVVETLREMRHRLHAADVKALRRLTGSAIMDAKKALDEAEGDVDKAVQILRIKRRTGAAHEPHAGVGAVVARVAADSRSGVLVELRCETDFVAKSDKFTAVAGSIASHIAETSPSDVEDLLSSEIKPGRTVQAFLEEAHERFGEKILLDRFAQFTGDYVVTYLHRTSSGLPPQVGVLVELDKENTEVAKDIAHHIAAFAPRFLTREDVPAETVENERLVAEAIAREEGKPENTLPKIVEGQVNAFFKENVLLDQPFVKDKKKSVQSVLDEAGVTLKRFARIRVGV